MPSDGNGVYSLPAGYLAVTGDTIQASQHNPPLEDLAAGLTARLMRSGANAMTGVLKVTDGTASAPGLAFADATNTGFYRTAAGILAAVGGSLAGGFVPIGTVLDFAPATAPTGWLLCYGQAISRTTYAALFEAIGTTYGVGDGSTTFNLPDLRGRVVAGQDDMGGSSANRLTNASNSLNGDTLGDAGGSETRSLSTSNLPAYTPAGTISTTGTAAVNQRQAASYSSSNTATAVETLTNSSPTGTYNAALTATSTFTGTAQGGTAAAFAIVQPTIILNKIIFTGVA